MSIPKKYRFIIVYFVLAFIIIVTLISLIWMHKSTKLNRYRTKKHILFYHLCSSQDTLYVVGKRKGPFFQPPLFLITNRQGDTLLVIQRDQIQIPNQPPLAVSQEIEWFQFQIEQDSIPGQYWLTILGYNRGRKLSAEPLMILKKCP